MGKKQQARPESTYSDINVNPDDQKLLSDARRELNDLEKTFGSLVAKLMNSPQVKELRENIDRADKAYQTIGFHVLKKYGIEPDDATNWRYDFQSGMIKHVNGKQEKK